MKKNKNSLRIVFMGTSPFSKDMLEALIRSNHAIIAAYTQPDQKIGRKQILEKTPVKILAEANGIPVFDPHGLDEQAIRNLKEQDPDLIILVAYGKILPKAVLEIPKLGAINIHPSLLPKYRGPSPIQNALLNGDSATGTTIMLMDPGVDTGDILAQREIAVDQQDKYPELEKKLSALSAELLLETLPRLADGEITPRKQDDSQASYCQLIQKSDGKINWNQSAGSIFNKYRAFFLWPGIFTDWNGRRIKLNKIRLAQIESDSDTPGEVFQIDGTIYVKTKTGSIILEELQIEGKSNLPIKSFLNGYPDFIGAVLK